jgi:beta-galactosidase
VDDLVKKPLVSKGPLYLGAAYYPEHWPDDCWAENIRLMREASINVVRMAEFAWSTLEPKAGEFQFDWLDRAISELAGQGIQTVLGTPTAAPPAWLVQEHPDLLAVEESGRRVQFGNRCHYCVTSPDFHAATQRIVEAMAGHFGANPSVIGWQVDNEYNRVCYCDRCRDLFQRSLKDKYCSLENLNQSWTTVYWSQTYSDWRQIPIPIGRHNPGLRLAFKHFTTETYRKFQKIQIDLLRQHISPEVWITHNFMGWYPGYDHYEMTADLDFASWDWYIGTGNHDYLVSGAVHDLTRGFKRKNFWLMETQPGHVNWSSTNNALDKGEARAMAWHAVSHGADAVLYWQWRSALNGQEQYHGSLLDASGSPRPFYQEVRQLGQDFQRAGALLNGSTVQAQAALLHDYDSRWSIDWDPHNDSFDYISHFNHYYRPFAASNIPVDVISADVSLDGYALVISPALIILDEARVKQLEEFVNRGGYLVLSIRTGMKDRHNALLPSRQPGGLREIAGVEVEDYYSLFEPISILMGETESTASLWAERLLVLDEPNVKVLATYREGGGWLDGHPAVTSHTRGAGKVYYIGTCLDAEAQQELMINIFQQVGLEAFSTPSGVEVGRRIHPDGYSIYLFINHTRKTCSVQLPWTAYDHLAEKEVENLDLSPYGVAVLTRKTEEGN